MDTTLVIFSLLVIWIGFTFVGALLLMRMNSQVKRVSELPGESRAVKNLREYYEDLDTRVRANKVAASSNADELEDVHRRIRSIQARDAAQSRRDAEVDVTKLADYIQNVTEDTPESAEAAPPESGIATTADGQQIDFR